MKLIMYGVNRNTVSCDDVHKYSLNKAMRLSHLNDISTFDGVVELLLVATNNRNEYYLYVDEKTFKHGDLLRYLSRHTGKPLEEIILETYSMFNDDVTKHLFDLTSILDETPESINFLEQALYESMAYGTIGNVLFELFNAAIDFSLSLYDKESLYPLINGEAPKAIQKLRSHYPEKKDINYLIIGNNEIITQLMKYLIRESGSYLTFLERNEKSRELIKNIDNWLALTNNFAWKNHIQSVDLGQLVYRLSKADVVIIGSSIKNAWLSNELLEDMYEMRPTAKRQLILDLSGAQDETVFSNYPTLSYTQINDTVGSGYSNEKMEVAKSFYDEYLTNQTNDFMIKFYEIAEEKITHMHVNKDANHNISYEKKISYKV
ncbi:hypothetical protein [Alkalibacterium sp. 20]|uniref:hypothetical protein n=1 Tax=Alkalibacterium sp. 20 TaxID=1798803 RepID=UPI00090031F8|nr:hypothetical protein [Alkalibacterium sp. 20]OJF95191.1 hypothetical protein AX762_06885 [Alkalibacterium sp. 20]